MDESTTIIIGLGLILAGGLAFFFLMNDYNAHTESIELSETMKMTDQVQVTKQYHIEFQEQIKMSEFVRVHRNG